MQNLVSIVVPIYNVEQYLSRCIDSIRTQTYKNIEIILVDDGATDNSGSICDKYAKIDQRIRVIHKKNGGLSDARNVGLYNAAGIYICFVDSDDYIDKNFISILYEMITKEPNIDIAQCSFKKVYDIENVPNIKLDSKIDYRVISSKEFMNNMYQVSAVQDVIACNKMYKRRLFENIKYPVGRVHEDEATTYKLIYNSKYIAISNLELYNYYQRNNSITKSNFNIKKLDYLYALRDRMNFLKEKNQSILYQKTLKQYCFYNLIFYYKCKKYITNSKKICKELVMEYKEVLKELVIYENKKKYVYIIGTIFPYFVGSILNFRSKNW